MTEDLHVARAQQGDADPVGHGLEGLLRGGHRRGDPGRPPAPVLGGQPEVQQRAGALRQGQERLVEQVGEVERGRAGEPVTRGQGHPPRLGDQDPPVVAVGLGERQPEQRDVDQGIGQPGRRVLPADLAQLDPPAGLAGGEVGGDRREQPAADGGGEPDGEHPYNASKHAIASLTKVAALELAEQNIRVNAFAPGAVDTPMLRRAAQGFGMTLEQIAQDYPIKRIVQPEEMARMVMWLASDDATAVVGTDVDASGGYLTG